MPLVKLVVLGASGTGKSSIINQFLESTFEEKSSPTVVNPRKNSYTFTVVMNGVVHEVKIVDMPVINYFPSNTLYEWTDYRGCALRSAHGYLLIFDLTSPVTFRYVKVIRDQLSGSRNLQNIPVYVVGNKADLCQSVLNSMRGGHSHHHHHHHNRYHHGQHRHGSGSHHSEDLTPAFKELANLVKKQWKCNYIECSAKYNWRVAPIFRDIIRLIELNQLKSAPETSLISHHQREQEHRDSIKSPSVALQQHPLTTSVTPPTLVAIESSSRSGTQNNLAIMTTRTSNDSTNGHCSIF